MSIPNFLSHMSKEDIKYIYSLPENKRMEKIMFCCDPKLLEELPDNTPDDYDAIGEWLKKEIQNNKLLIHKNEKDNNIRLEWKD